MNFDYSEEQAFLKDEARRFLAAHCSADAVPAVLDDNGVAYDGALWTAIAAQGWMGTAILFGSDAQKTRWLPGIADGSVIGAFATSEGPGPLTAGSVRAQVCGGMLGGESCRSRTVTSPT